MEQIIEDILLGHDERRPEVTLNRRIAAALRETREAAIEECANFVDSQEVLREHAGMSAVENMKFLLETTAENIRALIAKGPGLRNHSGGSSSRQG